MFGRDYTIYKKWFATKEEYISYCRCVNKVQIGDVVYIYVTAIGLTAQKTNTIIGRPVIAIVKGERFLLGSSVASYGFYHRNDADDEFSSIKKVADIKKYRYMWWLTAITDGRIAKIDLDSKIRFEDSIKLDALRNEK